MKRFYAFLFACCMAVMCGCSNESQKPILYIEGDAYNLAPQEYIDLVNSSIEHQDADYPTIPNWDEDAVFLEIDNRFIELSIETNDNGKITDIYYHWEIKSQEQADAAYFMAALTIGMVTGTENLQSVYDSLDMTRTGVSSYINECDENGSHFYFMSYGYGKYNDLRIHPAGNT